MYVRMHSLEKYAAPFAPLSCHFLSKYGAYSLHEMTAPSVNVAPTDGYTRA